MLQLSTSDWNVSAGDAKANDGFHSIQMRNCQNAEEDGDGEELRPRAFPDPRGPARPSAAMGTSSASRPDVSARSSTAMATHLVLETVGDRSAPARRPRRSRGGAVARWLIGYSSTMRPGRLDNRITRSPRRTASRTLWVTKITVEPGLAPEPLELVVQHVAGHRVERAERLVHEEHVGLLGERTGRARPAGACRRRARGGASRRTTSGSRGRGGRRPSGVARARGILRIFRGSSTLPRAVSHGNSADSWNMSVVRFVAGVDGAAARAVEAGDEVEQRALAAAGRAEQADELALRDVERDVVERVQRVALGAEHLRHVVDEHRSARAESSTTGVVEDPANSCLDRCVTASASRSSAASPPSRPC